jgi:hypothetical protein
VTAQSDEYAREERITRCRTRLRDNGRAEDDAIPDGGQWCRCGDFLSLEAEMKSEDRGLNLLAPKVFDVLAAAAAHEAHRLRHLDNDLDIRFDRFEDRRVQSSHLHRG